MRHVPPGQHWPEPVGPGDDTRWADRPRHFVKGIALFLVAGNADDGQPWVGVFRSREPYALAERIFVREVLARQCCIYHGHERRLSPIRPFKFTPPLEGNPHEAEVSVGNVLLLGVENNRLGIGGRSAFHRHHAHAGTAFERNVRAHTHAFHAGERQDAALDLVIEGRSLLGLRIGKGRQATVMVIRRSGTNPKGAEAKFAMLWMSSPAPASSTRENMISAAMSPFARSCLDGPAELRPPDFRASLTLTWNRARPARTQTRESSPKPTPV